VSGAAQFLGQVVAALAGVLVAAALLRWSLARDPRSLRNGLLLIVLVHYVLGLLVVLTATTPALQAAADVVELLVLVVVGLGLLLLPVLLLVDGAIVLRRERRTLGNALSLLTGLSLILLPVVLVVLLRHENPVTGAVAVALLTAQACVSLLFLVFATHTVLYARVARRAPARAVIVLGSGLVRGGVSPLLAGRLDRALAAVRDRTGPDGGPVLVPSGGRGSDEPLAEGTAMAAWLCEHGAAAHDVLVEDRARTTRENLVLSVELLRDRGVPGPYLAVTSDYHAPRAALLARRLGLDVQAIGAPTARYYLPSAYLREFVAVLLEHRSLLVLSALVVVAMATLTGMSLAAR